ncbi:hypothetical protein [Leisingera sp. D0M16]|uniref:hypothetical protein n=1 Tax=Leisingera coralii TaxID=3351347 RepID=UPI003B9DD56C
MYIFFVKSDLPAQRLLAKLLSSEGFTVVGASMRRSTVSPAASPPEESLGEYVRARKLRLRKVRRDILRDYFFNDTDVGPEDVIDVHAHILRQKLVEAALRRTEF